MDGDLDPVTEVEWVNLACVWGTSGTCVLGYPAGYIDSRIAVFIRWYDLTMALYRSKNWKMKGGEIVLIA